MVAGCVLSVAAWSQAAAFEQPRPLPRLELSSKFAIEPVRPEMDRLRSLYFNLLGPDDGAGQRSKFRYTVDIGTDFDTWLDRRVPPTTHDPEARSVAMLITSKVDENVKDKILLSPLAHDSDDHISVLNDDNERFFAFDFMLDPSYEVPHNWALHFQAWQCCSGHPPLVIAVSPGNDRAGVVEFDFQIRNDSTETERFGQAISIFKMPVKRGVWQNFILRIEPRAVGSRKLGAVTLWLDRVEKFDWRGYWGFSPNTNSNSTKGLVRDNIGLDVGVYRRRQSTTQIVFFDNIKVGTTFDQVLSSRKLTN